MRFKNTPRHSPTIHIWCRMYYYLTRAGSSPASDLGKAVLPGCLPPACLLPPAVLLCPLFDRGSSQHCLCSSILSLYLISTHLTNWTDSIAPSETIIWQRFCEQSTRPSMPMRIPSQITVDCKSVHYSSLPVSPSLRSFKTSGFFIAGVFITDFFFTMQPH